MKDFDPSDYLHILYSNNGSTAKTSSAKINYIDSQLLTQLEQAMQAIELARMDLTADYQDWLRIGFALASLGEAGREYYHRISCLNANYTWTECEEKFNRLLKEYDGKIGIGTFFYYCRKVGLSWKDSFSFTPTQNYKSNESADRIDNSSNLEKVLSTRELLTINKKKEIIFSAPILKQEDNPILFPNTINTIQGQAGVHKSRLAETICSVLLKRTTCQNTLLNFTANPFKSYSVCYVDTERNLSEQLPYALQQIQVKAGYPKEEHPANFDYISLLNIPRRERFTTLTEYLYHVRQTFTNHILIVLDVTSDCVRDFNKSEDSMELIDLMNEAINSYDVTFLCLIHENPGGSKARGHLGTELMNKSSTVIQVGFEKDGSNQETDIIRIKYLKCRTTKRPEPLYVCYCESAKELVIAGSQKIEQLTDSRKQKAHEEDIIAYLEKHLTAPMPGKILLAGLIQEFGAKDRTVRERISKIIEGDVLLYNKEAKPCLLMKRYEGRELVYWLQPIEPTIKDE
jgi:hypothetical protein